MSSWTIWLITAAILLAIELLSGSIVTLCLSVGALVAIIPALLGASVLWQAIIALVVSIVAFIFLGPLVKRLYSKRHKHEYVSNMDALIGRYGKVTKEVTNNFDDKGRVQIDGDNWLAYTTSPDWPIHRGEQVIVEAYDSLVLKVRPAKTARNEHKPEN